MRIGIDTRDLKTATTGQKTYLEELCRAFREMDTEHTFHFLDTSIPAFKGDSKFIKILEQLNLHFWKQFVLPLKAFFNRCDVLLCTDYFVPYITPGFKTFAVFHDAFFYENPEHYHPLLIKLFKYVALPSARRCEKIIVPSHYSKKQVAAHYRIDPEKIVTIYEGPKSLPLLQGSPDVLRRLGIEGERYLLHVGVMNKRKNIPFLIDTYKQLLDSGEDCKLVLAGSLHTSRYIDDSAAITAAIARNGLEKNVILTGYLSDEDLAAVYRHALLYVFPSLNEGFGLPLVEAFRYSLPVLVANNTCLPEIGGDAVMGFDPHDTNDLLNQLKTLLTNAALRSELAEKGKRRLPLFSWKKAASEMTELFERAQH